MNEEPKQETVWAIVELMGHVRLAGKLSEIEQFGAKRLAPHTSIVGRCFQRPGSRFTCITSLVMIGVATFTTTPNRSRQSAFSGSMKRKRQRENAPGLRLGFAGFLQNIDTGSEQRIVGRW